MTLDNIFEPDFRAVDLFTGRVAESAAFSSAVLHHLECVIDGTATLAELSRRNVLSFYGVGGIGKTELSQRLQRWILGEAFPGSGWGEPLQLDHPVRTSRFDLHGVRAVDAVDVVLGLRAAVARAGRRFPAFDLGLAAWWSVARLGIALPDLSHSTGFDVRGQMIDTIGDVIGDVALGFGVGQLTARTGIRIIEAIRSRRLRDRTLNDCQPLITIVEHATTDASPYVAASLAGLLTWDIERLTRSEQPLVVAFVDSLEYIQGRDRHQERLVNRIVHLTPGVLWVVTSQRSLDWADPALIGVLPAAGRHVWPGLSLRAEDEPRQHLVGDLADEDVLRYLNRASGRGGNPVLTDEAIELIRDGAHGLPLYLDLSLSIARSAAVGGVGVHTFGSPLPALVSRVFADLPDEERDIARTASLLPRFDPALLAEAAQRLSGDVARFCRRTLVRRDDHVTFPFRLHDAIRSAVADEAVHNPGAWSVSDRRARAESLLEVLRQRHDAGPDSVELRRDILELCAGICADHDLEAPWLRTALIDLPGMALTADRMPPPNQRTWIGQLSTFLRAWQGRTNRQRIAYLTELTTKTLRPDIARATRIFLAYAERAYGDKQRALELLSALYAQEPGSSLLRYQVGRTLYGMCRYGELRDLLRQSPPSVSTEEQRLRSDLAWERGNSTEGINGAAARAAYLCGIGQHRIALENDATVLWRSAVAGRITADDCNALIAEIDAYGMTLTLRTSLAAKAICLRKEPKAVDAVLTEMQSIIDVQGGSHGWREWAVMLVRALRHRDDAEVRTVREQWEVRRRNCSPSLRFIDRLFVHAGYDATFAAVHLSNRDDAQVDQRWRRIITKLVGPPWVAR
ncbi:hypothetical protein AWW66_05350 [Micromonospora rosaria]|uniref:Orc1-like AAA ATPase domain-containing protein n=1 Tax=Micromonospora rosaria TaxID=47874 RepID=A0A136PX48_9ACTN|nr:hypothetical protein [Micromonospora rosaria]KXK63069.1 hypothetical protein AWW66_05350 [Micromonospora rosaria]